MFFIVLHYYSIGWDRHELFLSRVTAAASIFLFPLQLHPTVRAHMNVLFARGVRRPDEMAAQLRRFVKAEMGGPREDLSLQPSMWTIRRLLKTMASEEGEEVSSGPLPQPPSAVLANALPPQPATNPKRARIDLASPPPPASPEQRPRKIFTSSDGPGFPVVKLEENHVELVRCVKCGVRVPFHSDGSRAAQDAALMAHLANSHGIRKRDPIVYPAARQRSQSAQDHVTDLDAEAEEGKAEIRILKETGVLPTAATSSSVEVSPSAVYAHRCIFVEAGALNNAASAVYRLSNPPIFCGTVWV